MNNSKGNNNDKKRKRLLQQVEDDDHSVHSEGSSESALIELAAVTAVLVMLRKRSGMRNCQLLQEITNHSESLRKTISSKGRKKKKKELLPPPAAAVMAETKNSTGIVPPREIFIVRPTHEQEGQEEPTSDVSE